MIASFGVAFQPEHRSGSVSDSNGVFPWGSSPFRRSPQTRSQPQPQLQQKSTLPKAESAPKREQHQATKFDFLLFALHQRHQPGLAQELAEIPKLAQQRQIKLFCLKENDPVIYTTIELLGGLAPSSRGSFALLGTQIPIHVVVLVESEIQAIASQLGLEPSIVRQSMAAHEIAHTLGWQAYQLGVNNPDLLGEQLAWLWGSNIRAKYSSVPQHAFDRVAGFCLASYGL